MMGDGPDIRGERLRPHEYEANFDDLDPPLGRRQALIEASRCWFCHDAPCIEACPTGIDIPGFIRGIQTDNLKGAADLILEANIMGGTCARVCPTEVLCEAACVRVAQEGAPVRIGRLQRYATDWVFDEGYQPFERATPTGRRIAVVGAGPAGLACAHGLARNGHDVTVYERSPRPGGLNEYGIAAYKMAHAFAAREVAFIASLGGIEIVHGKALGRDLRLLQLREDFDAVFLGVGLTGVNALGLEGEDEAGVLDAVDFIGMIRQAPDKSTLPIGRDIVVIGGGNTAIDAAIQSRRLGAQRVTIVYRRGPEHMGATEHEQSLALNAGVVIRHWAMPTRLVIQDDQVRGLELVGTTVDRGGRVVPTGETFSLPADQLFKAIGQKLIRGAHPGELHLLEISGGKITIDASGATSLAGVWAGGDCVGTGPDLTVVAVEDGKRAAAAIHRHLTA